MKRIFSILLFLLSVVVLFAYKPSGRGVDWGNDSEADYLNGVITFYIVRIVIILVVLIIIGYIITRIIKFIIHIINKVKNFFINYRRRKILLSNKETHLFKNNRQELELCKEIKRNRIYFLSILFSLVFSSCVCYCFIQSIFSYHLIFTGVLFVPSLIFLISDFDLMQRKLKYYWTFDDVEKTYKNYIIYDLEEDTKKIHFHISDFFPFFIPHIFNFLFFVCILLVSILNKCST